jgi:hypothetical protein
VNILTFFSKPSVNNFQVNSGNTPLLYPVRVICPANVTTGISFPDQFLGRAISLKITNNDAANATAYDYNLNGQFQNLAASSFATVDNTIVNYLTINAGAAGTTLVEAQVIPATRDQIPIEVEV